MRTDEELIASVHRRAARIEGEARGRRARLARVAVVAAGLAAVVALALWMPALKDRALPDAGPSLRASLLFEGGGVAYAAICVTGFLLGVLVTLFCFRLKAGRKEDDHDRDR